MLKIFCLKTVRRTLNFRCYSTMEANRVKSIGPNVFAQFSELAREHGAVNMGQGFPSFPTPTFIQEAAIEAIRKNNNQYTRPGGNPEFVKALADIYSILFKRSIDPMKEIVTFTGAQEGIFCIFASLLNPGDEVIVVEPYFDAYINCASILELKTKGIPLKMNQEKRKAYQDINSKENFSSKDLILDLNKLDQMITSQTKMLVLNTPHNPTGKVFSKNELNGIANILKKHPHVIVLSDEVYEFMCFDENKHERIALIEGLEDRVISLFSAGKTFSCTGWRVGYAICPPKFTNSIIKMHSSIPFCVPTPFEVAMAKGFKHAFETNYFEKLSKMLQEKRDALGNALVKANMRPIIPEGGYFICCNAAMLQLYQYMVHNIDSDVQSYPDYRIALKLCSSAKIACIPTSPFYSKENRHLAGGTIRLAFCKDDVTLNKAIHIISTLSNY